MDTSDLFRATATAQPAATGLLRKLRTRWLPQSTVGYELPIAEQLLPLNERLGQTLSLQYHGKIHCLHCGKETSKSFGQGYCYQHFVELAQNDACIMAPEKCHYHQGTCREPAWGERNCMQTHYVYLANASGLKVGITRGTQVPTRWLDQGATQAIAIARVTTRQLAGFMEVVFKNHVADKTNWREMLKGEPEALDMAAERDRLFALTEGEVESLLARYGNTAIQRLTHGEVYQFDYPVLRYPQKVTSFNLDKDQHIEGTLMGIKGQYLIFDTGVINIRRFGGYSVSLK